MLILVVGAWWRLDPISSSVPRNYGRVLSQFDSLDKHWPCGPRFDQTGGNIASFEQGMADFHFSNTLEFKIVTYLRDVKQVPSSHFVVTVCYRCETEQGCCRCFYQLRGFCEVWTSCSLQCDNSHRTCERPGHGECTACMSLCTA